MDAKILENIGLTKNEIKIYLALLELGTTTTGPLTRKSELHSSRVYESLNKLIEKGLVSFVIKANRKHYSAADPDVILDILEEEKRDIITILPELRAMHKQKPGEEKSTMYEGYKGVKSVYDNIVRTLNKGDEILVFGARGADESFMSKTFFIEYTKRRIARGIKMKMIFNADSRETGKYYSKLKNTEVKYMPKNMKTPAAVDIYANNVGTLILKPKPIVFLITSKEVANSYRQFFKLFWRICKR
jgi:sugar-specific transcriptional regulator TrmB